jgi:hypothetical protein
VSKSLSGLGEVRLSHYFLEKHMYVSGGYGYLAPELVLLRWCIGLLVVCACVVG